MSKKLLALTTAVASLGVIYIGPKQVKKDNISGYTPAMRFKRFEEVSTPVAIAQALLNFDCFVEADEANIERYKAMAESEAETLLGELAEKEELLEKEKQAQDTFVTVDGDQIDLLKMTYAELKTFCLGQELDVERMDGENKNDLVVRIRVAFNESNQE